MTRKEVLGPELLNAHVQGVISRAQLLTALGVGVAAAVAPGAVHAEGPVAAFSSPFFPQTAGTYTTEQAADIVSNLLTLKVFDAALGAFAFGNPDLLARLGVTGVTKSIFQAIIAQDQYHIDWLSSLMPGISAVTASFTVDPKLAATPQSFATFGLFTGYVYLGAELTAAREFAELGQPTLAKNMAQLAAAEGESLAAFRTILAASGASTFVPPNNKAFETEVFLYTRDAVALMKAIGLIGGTGVPLVYPGRSAVLAAAGPIAGRVVQTMPNNATRTVTFTDFARFGGEQP